MEERRGGVCSERGEELLQCEWRRGGVAYARNAVKAFSLSEAGAATGGNHEHRAHDLVTVADPNSVQRVCGGKREEGREEERGKRSKGGGTLGRKGGRTEGLKEGRKGGRDEGMKGGTKEGRKG
jgi:hypothetical protein